MTLDLLGQKKVPLFLRIKFVRIGACRRPYKASPGMRSLRIRQKPHNNLENRGIPMGMEIEWKYQATPEILEEIANSFSGKFEVFHMKTVYFDTPDRLLSA